ncbi:MAG: phage tail sheath family protein [Sphingomicrobium sp.]
MPEYLAPGVFVEEVSYRAKSIEGVSTTTTGFVGATRYGPIDIEPDIITSLVEFERVYGGKQQLDFRGPVDNYMWNAVRAFFEEGGKRCYVARAFDYGFLDTDEEEQRKPKREAATAHVLAHYPPTNLSLTARFPGKAGECAVTLQFDLSRNRFSTDGTVARLAASFDRDVVAVAGLAAPAKDGLFLLSRDEQKGLWNFDNGKSGGASVKFELQDMAGVANLTVKTMTATVTVDPTDSGLPTFVATNLALDPEHKIAGTPDSLFAYFGAEQPTLGRERSVPIILRQLSKDEADAASAAAAAEFTARKNAATAATATATTTKNAADAAKTVFETAETDAVAKEADALANPGDAAKQTAATTARTDADAKKADFETKQRAADAAVIAKDVAIARKDAAKEIADGTAVMATAAADGPLDGLDFATAYVTPTAKPERFTLKALKGLTDDDKKLPPNAPILNATYFLTGGTDGNRPGPETYRGAEDPATNRSSGLKSFERLEDISIVAAPGHTAEGIDEETAQAIALALISHAERMQYRIAVLDSLPKQSISDVRDFRAKLDSKHAALYYPWVKVIDPLTGVENHYPPSGFVAGIYARNDVDRAVYKAPANEVVRLAIGFEKLLSKAQQEVLNPEGINCFRYFEGRGMRLWGARTISSDPEWKYVNLRRYFAYLERSIDKGTQWAVFEPNGERLWANVRRTIEDFLLNEWQNGALLGDRPEKAYFVKCDRSTMTQNDLDNGRLVCLVGVAALRPAEFVIFRIGQWTADRKI